MGQFSKGTQSDIVLQMMLENKNIVEEKEQFGTEIVSKSMSNN